MRCDVSLGLQRHSIITFHKMNFHGMRDVFSQDYVIMSFHEMRGKFSRDYNIVNFHEIIIS